jgi:Tol biopolymer transport system component
MAEEEAGRGVGPWADTDFKFAWALTGKAIYFERSFRRAKNIWRMTVDPETLRATGMERLTTGSEGEAEFALSADGSKLAFTSEAEQVRAWMFPFDATRGRVTGAGQAATSPGLQAWEGSLSQDGKKLAFASKRAGKWEMWEKSFLDGREMPIAADDMYVRNEPQWSPDGTRLAYVRQKPSTVEQQAVIRDSKTGNEEEVTALTHRFMMVFDWSPDGKWLLVSEENEQSGQTEIWEEPATGGHEKGRKIVPSELKCDLWQGRFSPDGRWIAFEAVKSKAEGFDSTIYVAPTAGGAWIRITEGKHWDDKPRWSPDGKTIYFVSERGGFLNVFGRRFDPAASKPIGDMFQVTQFHDPRSLMIANSVSTIGLSVTQDRLMVTVSQGSGSIWILDNVDR